MSENTKHFPEDVLPLSSLNIENQQIYTDMVRYMKLKLQRPFTAPKIVMLIASGVKFLAKIKSLSGPEKKDLVLHALRETVQCSTYIKESEKADIVMMIDTIGEPIVEQLVNFAKDTYTFIKKKSRWCASNNVEPKVGDRNIGDAHSVEYTALNQQLRYLLQLPITTTQIIAIIGAGVKFIQRYRDLSGAEKKDIVIRVVRDIIIETDLILDKDREGLILVVDTFADDTIEYLVDFGREAYLKVKKGCKC